MRRIAMWIGGIILALIILVPASVILYCTAWLNGGLDEIRIGPQHYQYTYDVREDWALHMNKRAREEGLFGYGEYRYQSYLLLFPRETPSTLKEYYFHWSPLIDVDGFACYFAGAGGLRADLAHGFLDYLN